MSILIQVPSHRQMIVNVQNVSFTCPGLQLNIRDGVETRDTLLYTIHVDTNVSVSVRTSGHVSRLELVSDSRSMNSSLCFAVMHVGVIIKGNLHLQNNHHVTSIPQNGILVGQFQYLSNATSAISIS